MLMKLTPLTRQWLLLAVLLTPLATLGQMIPHQSVNIEYDGAGNRIVRKLWNPQNPSNKTGDTHVTGSGTKVFPNPASGALFVQRAIADSTRAEVWLINAMGQPIDRQWIRPYETQVQFHLERLPQGLYQVLLRQGQRTETVHIIHL